MSYFVQIVNDGTPGALYEAGDDYEAAKALLKLVLLKGEVEITPEVAEVIEDDGYYVEGGFGVYIVSSEVYKEEATDATEVELSNGGAIQFDTDDGTIRYIDVDGNTEGVYRPGDEEYDQYKSQYFPNVNVSLESEVGYSIKDSVLYHSMYPDESLGEFQDGGFIPSRFLLELPPDCHRLVGEYTTQYLEDEAEEDRRDHKRGLYGK